MTKDMYDDILEHFETDDGVLEIEQSYDMTVEGALDTLEMDSAKAYRAVRDLSLNYDIQARHEAKRVGDEEEINSVNVVWNFWK